MRGRRKETGCFRENGWGPADIEAHYRYLVIVQGTGLEFYVRFIFCIYGGLVGIGIRTNLRRLHGSVELRPSVYATAALYERRATLEEAFCKSMGFAGVSHAKLWKRCFCKSDLARVKVHEQYYE